MSTLNRLPMLVCAGALCLGAQAAPRNVDRLSTLVSGPSPFVAHCNGVPQQGTNYPNAEVEPFVAANPLNPRNLVGVWQQDRWSDGGSQGLGTASSFDGGLHWTRQYLPLTRCAGGSAANGGDYERGTDPWVSFSPNGVVHQMVLGFSPEAGPNQIGSAMLALRSVDGGRTWGRISTLQADHPGPLNDKNALTADPTDARFVYAIWDRLGTGAPGESGGPTLFARSNNNGVSWEPTRIIYDDGENAQTIGNRIEVLPSGILVNLFTRVDYLTNALELRVIRSTDKGQTWSLPIKVADLLAQGASDPQTGQPIRDGAVLAQMAISRRGIIHVVWQDARFSNGRVDGIALSQSTDGGLSWSAPVQINRDRTVQAFTPSIHVRRNGSIGVSYYDLRSNTADPATLFTDLWLTRSQEGRHWREARITSAFDLKRAPFARGYFLGDYQGLTSIGPVFIPFFARSGGPDTNRNDIYSHVAIGNFLEGAAANSAEAEAAIAAEEAAMPGVDVQDTARSTDAVPADVQAVLHASAWQAFENHMRAHVRDWDLRRARRLAPQ